MAHSVSISLTDRSNSQQVQHAKRTQSLAHLPPFQSETVHTVVSEVRELDKDVTRLLEPFAGGSQFNPAAEPATACALLVDHLCMRRNKRCLLAYHRVRAEKLEELCWNGVDVMEVLQQQHLQQVDRVQGGGGGGGAAQSEGSSMTGAANQHSLSPDEEEYLRRYNDLLTAYKGQWTDIDLTGSLEPPKDLFIDVRVLKDAGEIQTEYGYVAHSIHFGFKPCVKVRDILTIRRFQVYQFNEEQPVLRTPSGRGSAHRPRLSPAAKLNS